MTDPRRWRADPSRQVAADLLLRGARCPRAPDADELARLSKIVCDIPRRAALRQRRVVRTIAAVACLTLSASFATSVWAWRRAEGISHSAGLAPPACLEEPAQRDTPRTSGRPPVVVPARTVVRKPARRSDPTVSLQPTRAEPPSRYAAADPLLRETELIAAARSALATAPAAALARLDEHRRDFPDGQLAPERDLLAVDALCRSNQISEARQRAADLGERYPSTSYGARAMEFLNKRYQMTKPSSSGQ